MANDHAAIIRQHDFDPTQCPRFRPQGWRIFRCFKAGPVLRRAAGRRFASNDRLGKDHRAAVPGEPPFARQTSPREQLARRQTMTPRCRRYHPAAILALGNDPLLLLKRPTPPGARRNHFKPRDLRNRRMVSHTPMSSRHPVPARWASPDAYPASEAASRCQAACSGIAAANPRLNSIWSSPGRLLFAERCRDLRAQSRIPNRPVCRAPPGAQC